MVDVADGLTREVDTLNSRNFHLMGKAQRGVRYSLLAGTLFVAAACDSTKNLPTTPTDVTTPTYVAFSTPATGLLTGNPIPSGTATFRSAAEDGSNIVLPISGGTLVAKVDDELREGTYTPGFPIWL